MVKVNELELLLLQRRVVGLVDDINDKSVSGVMRGLMQLQLESSEPSYLIIDSSGGSLYSALGLYDAIEHLFAMEVHAIVHGDCKSAATFVLLACTKRLATPHSQFMIHSGMKSNIALKTDELTAAKLQQLQTEIEQDTEAITALYQKKLRKSTEEIKKYIARGDQQFNNSFTAQEALEIGLITEIVEGKLPFFPPLQQGA